MKRKGGIWVPDGDTGILNDMPQVAGVPAYQLNRLDAALDHLPPARRRVAVDAGAHVGLWTLHMSRYFGLVVAFEPVTSNIECWLRNCAGLTNAILHQEALGEEHGNIRLSPADGTSWSWTADPRAWKKSRGAEMVPCAPLDSLEMPVLDFLKVDVEGHEYAVLRGATSTLRRCRPVVLVEEKHDTERRASALLEELGYREVWRKKHDRLFVWR